MTKVTGISRGEILKQEHSLLTSIANAGSDKNINRYSLSEIRNVCTINVPEFRKDADRVAKLYRELDTGIQEANWRTDLIE